MNTKSHTPNTGETPPMVEHKEQLIHPTTVPEPEETPPPAPLRRPAVDPSEIYPDAVKDAGAMPVKNSSFWEKENLGNKTVASQVKVLMVLAILGLLVCGIGLIFIAALLGLGRSVPGLGVTFVIVLIDTLVYLYLLLSKNASTVALILKILLVLDLISVFGIFFGFPAGFSLSSIVSLLLTYLALTGVRGLYRNY